MTSEGGHSVVLNANQRLLILEMHTEAGKPVYGYRIVIAKFPAGALDEEPLPATLTGSLQIKKEGETPRLTASRPIPSSLFVTAPFDRAVIFETAQDASLVEKVSFESLYRSWWSSLVASYPFDATPVLPTMLQQFTPPSRSVAEEMHSPIQAFPPLVSCFDP